MEPRLNEITDYKPTRSWEELFTRANQDKRDDGHAAKFLRLLAYGEKVCKPFEEKDGFKIKGDMWNKLGNMRKYYLICNCNAFMFVLACFLRLALVFETCHFKFLPPPKLSTWKWQNTNRLLILS
jgi:hypothetical protein